MTFNKNDVSGSGVSRKALKALSDVISTRRHVFESLWWWPSLSTTEYHNDDMKCPTTLTKIIHQVPRNYYKEYTRHQVSRRKRDRERKKRNKKMKNETITNMHALREQTCMRSGSRPSSEGTRLLSAGDTVNPMMCPAWWTAEERQKRPGEHS